MSLRTWVPEIKTALLDLLFPLRCLNCGAEGSLMCPSCCHSLPRMEPPLCQSCGVPLSGGTTCAACIRHPLAVDGIRSLFVFEGTVRQAIHQLKYRHLKAMAAPLGQLLAEFLRLNPMPADVLIPVPLHPKRLRERGYNQASLLAIVAGRASGVPVAERSLLRLRDTVSQARAASALERRNNVRDAFGCPRGLHGEKVLLIDDVCTTGATLSACAAALRAAGAGSVWGLTVAREALSSPLQKKALENRGTASIK